jgi:hypothetical protein
MWQLSTIVILLVIGIFVYRGSDIVHWHSAFQSAEFNALAAWTSFYGLAISFLGLFVSGYAAWGTYEKIQLLKNEIDHYLADEKWEN